MEEIIKIGDLPGVLLEQIKEYLGSFTVGFLRFDATSAGLEPTLLGSGTLVSVGKKHAILTAHHVLEVLPRNGRLGLALSPTIQQHAIDTKGVAYIEIARGADEAGGPDLGAVVISATVASSIAAVKSFYNLDTSRHRMLNDRPPRDCGVWGIQGFVDEWTTEELAKPGHSRVKRFYHLLGFGGPEPVVEVDNYDYFHFPVSDDCRSIAPSRFNGMSGGGLWQIPLTRSSEGRLVNRKAILSGVIFYQEPTTEAVCGVKCHGPISVYQVAYDAIQESG